MDAVRYILGVILIVMTPPALSYWLIIHPFASFWRKLGRKLTVLIVMPALGGFCVFLYSVRNQFLGPDLGTNWIFVGAGLILFGIAMVVGVRCRRLLSIQVMVGIPELSGDAGSERLLREGIYNVVRHPRYLSIYLGTISFALCINYVGAYVMTVVLFGLLYFVILLEERELLDRFGQEYAEYQGKVPRLLPRTLGGVFTGH